MPNYKKKIRRAARRQGVRPELLLAQLTAESGLNPEAVSPVGARGIAQFMPGTAKSYGVDLYDGKAGDDIKGAARMMADMLKRFGGDERKALAAYNAGPGNVDKYGGVPPFAETQAYVKNILARAGDAKPGETSPRVTGSRSQATYETIPGQDNSGLRKSLLLNYLGSERGKPNALLDLKASLDGAQDIPAKRIKMSAHSGSLRTTPGEPLHGGLPGAVSLVDQLIKRSGLPTTAKQEPGHAAGGDHDPAVKGATARDIGGGEQTREQLFRALTRKLGVKNAVYKGPDINVVKNGVRYQIISRDHGTGPHLHVGMRKV